MEIFCAIAMARSELSDAVGPRIRIMDSAGFEAGGVATCVIDAGKVSAGQVLESAQDETHRSSVPIDKAPIADGCL